jgi:hypothetical protein
MLAQTATPTTSPTWIIVAIVVLVVVAIVVIATQRRRSQALRDRFGPEYDRTVRTTGSQQRAEAELAQRQKRYKHLDIRPLTPGARDRYADSWRSVQGRFVDEPGVAVGEADRLVNEVMRDRGYPPDDPQNRMDDLSVEHATVLGNYRTATAIAQRNARGEATTEELRVALVSYRALFADLLGTDPVRSGTVEGRIVEPRRTDTSQGVRR